MFVTNACGCSPRFLTHQPVRVSQQIVDSLSIVVLLFVEAFYQIWYVAVRILYIYSSFHRKVVQKIKIHKLNTFFLYHCILHVCRSLALSCGPRGKVAVLAANGKQWIVQTSAVSQCCTRLLNYAPPCRQTPLTTVA